VETNALLSAFSIYDSASATSEDASTAGKTKLALLWRAIILSSIGGTFYPYCLWIKSLKLRLLNDTLLDAAQPRWAVADVLFSGDMEDYWIYRRGFEGGKRPMLDIQAIINKAGEAITSFVKISAEQQNQRVKLDELEGEHIPMHLLPIWISRLSSLTTLSLHEGSVLAHDAGIAIRDHCPGFEALHCLHCNGPTVDDDLAAFLKTLKKDSLKALSILSVNSLGRECFTALRHHATSLRKLTLLSLGDSAFEHLHCLEDCVALESLALERADKYTRMDWENQYKDAFLQTTSWLRECSQLQYLSLKRIPSAGRLLGQILNAPEIRLKSLDVSLDLSSSDSPDTFSTSLGHQSELESLTVRLEPEGFELSPQAQQRFVQSVCKCTNLRDLDLLPMQLSLNDIRELASSLRRLEAFTFDGGHDDESWDNETVNSRLLKVLVLMPQLRQADIFAITHFTFEGIEDFIYGLCKSTPDEAKETSGNNSNSGDEPPSGHTEASAPEAAQSEPVPNHEGFQLSIERQAPEAQISENMLNKLSRLIDAKLGGRLRLEYWRDPADTDDSDAEDFQP